MVKPGDRVKLVLSRDEKSSYQADLVLNLHEGLLTRHQYARMADAIDNGDTFIVVEHQKNSFGSGEVWLLRIPDGPDLPFLFEEANLKLE